MASSSSSSPEIAHAAPLFDSSFFTCASLDDVLEELSTRFIMNLPEQELASVERICFQVEQAHWYYEDFMREANTKLPTLSLKKFSSMFFNSCPLLRRWSSDHERLFDTFMHYKVRVPVCGAIMLNDKWDKCLLVKGWKSSAGWGFPKGKINQLEELHMCAIREVQEETGFDLTKYIRPEDYIETTIREQSVTLFVVGGIPEDYPFQCRTRKEISKIAWFKVSELPNWKRNKQVAGKFYLISPFIPPLKEFIRVNKPNRRRQNRRKSGDIGTDLVIHTNLKSENNEEAEVRGESQVSSYGAVNLDRDAQGYSSSSVDNGDPQTPSPQSAEAYPIARVDSEREPEPAIDPHFARLLSGLTLSASKTLLDGQSEPRATSVTPTSAKINPKAVIEGEATSVSQSPSTDAGQSPLRKAVDASQASLVSSLDSILISSRPNGSSVTIRPQSTHSAIPESHMPPPPADRRLKHLALLESVAQESAVMTSPTPPVRSAVHPGPPLSVPPLPFRAEDQVVLSQNFLPPSVVQHHVPPAARQASLQIGDPFTVRPMTSQAAFPPSPFARQAVPNLNARQGSLLSILSGPSDLPAHNLQFRVCHANGAMLGLGSPFVSGGVQEPQLPRQTQPQALAPQPIRMMPDVFQVNPGSLTGPHTLAPIHPYIYRPGTVTNANGSQTANRTHLLSLLNSDGTARPTSTLHADATWSNYPMGRSAFGARRSGGIAHR
ncbi:hypothetical protein M0805_004310 [Coniferiporia weirii]|nr:hypothetical protein M0805_004310 [Coniferiporia weirii]